MTTKKTKEKSQPSMDGWLGTHSGNMMTEVNFTPRRISIKRILEEIHCLLCGNKIPEDAQYCEKCKSDRKGSSPIDPPV